MWSSLKQLIKSNKERCIIIEDGEPKYVILAYEQYQHLQKHESDSIVRENLMDESVEECAEPSLQNINGEIQHIKEEGLKIEDLPF